MSRTIATALATTLCCALALAGASAASAATAPVPLTQVVHVTGKTASGTKLRQGRFTIDHFAKRGGKLLAVGTLKGRLAGRRVSRTVRMPVQRPTIQGAAASQLPPVPNSCQILNLVLGPINLNLLGLVVRTNQINLRIDAQRGAGNLLGNLLCAITGALDPGTLANSPLGQLAQLLNSLLALAPRTA